MKVSKNFYLQEFVPKEVYDKYGDRSTWFVRPSVVEAAQFIRTHFGKSMTINNWHKGGSYNERGYRVPDSNVGATYSQHKLCAAWDFTIEGIGPNEVRSSILDNAAKFLPYLTTLEHEDYAPTWVHADQRWTKLDTILIVKPATGILEVGDNEEYFTYDKVNKYKKLYFFTKK